MIINITAEQLHEKSGNTFCGLNMYGYEVIHMKKRNTREEKRYTILKC